MAETAYLRGLEVRGPDLGFGRLDSPRHSAVVRITHWITAASFIALLVSGIAILIAHPRLYWGETGGVGTPSLIDLPIRSEEHTSELQSHLNLVCRLLLEKKKKTNRQAHKR